ncbi:hypothetical protein WICPIJ_003103 [Wickerhamomyces pijperi]|uniref:C2H2-type domain-containing protein n=1 Tax=Wickerhamomyces pijperi TaxID=599730 RepID=A0A9P8QAJ5_WICPI|nr:hypothetical protein WICPIJ_003103 [Wickerhamomyces pijperi]
MANSTRSTPNVISSELPNTPLSSVPPSRASGPSSRPKIYTCDYEGCSKVYAKPSLLTQHQRVHSETRPFSCALCDSAFFRESHLKVHMISHSSEKPFKCSTCGKGTNTAQHLKRHEVTHTKSFHCEYEGCGESFYKHQQLRHHKLSVHEKALTCEYCGKSFPRPYRLANHKQKHHGSAPAYQCDFPGCMTSLKTWSALQLHMKTEHPKLNCTVCNKGCVGEEGLRMHMLVHDQEKSLKVWKCTECSQDFQKKEELIVHCRNDHGFIPNNIQELEKKDNIVTVAGKRVTQEQIKKLIERREINVMDILTKSSQAEVELMQCSYKNCQRTFKKEFDLKRHLEWHDKLNQSFIDRGILKVDPETNGLVVASENGDDS